jgi:hypothetical protein
LSGIFRKPAFWIGYAAVALAALAIAVRYFPLALPLVNLDVELSRGEAIARAEALAAKLRLAPADARRAARFDRDAWAQNYIELEGGGRAAFAALTRGDVYAPYWWSVRLFTPGTIEEVILRFKPDGTADGFMRRVAETFVRDPAMKSLPAAEARALAETRAREDWGVDFSRYRFLEQAQQTLPSGRTDQRFVYERPEKLGDARVRLRLIVAGDELVGVVPFMFVPEAFGRRFQEMRSANKLIGGVASASAGLLYGLGGCVLGVLWLLRKHWLLWRPAFVAGLVVGGLMALATLSSAPAAWFGADTTETPTTFWLKQAGAAIFLLTAGGLGYALAFMAAESLSRRAFPHHPQLWRIWSRQAAPTPQIAGRTLGGYLFVPIELALIVGFYYATNRYLGWWQPSEMLSDPNILSSVVPALPPIAISLQAGFMEECVFRAIPLALGAIVGERYGRRRLGIAIAFVVQALVFGGAHANYPGLPSYSRLIELIVPSMLWALIFLRFGLLPTIILHAIFDLVLFAIPVFLVHSPYAFLQQALIVAAGLVPVAIVLWNRSRAGAWRELPQALRNDAWRPPVPAPAQPPPEAARRAPASRIGGAAAAFQRALPVLGTAGAVVWLVVIPMRTDAPPLPIDRASALAQAEEALVARGVKLGPEWRRFATVRLASDDAYQWPWHKFVWREAGPDAYRTHVGAALAPPVWEVRYATFDGDVAERAEEWRVTIKGDGGVRTIRHTLPEARAGARLSRDAALALAERELEGRLGAEAAEVRLVAADEKRLDARTDWSFSFADPRVDVGKDAELRYVVEIAGDEAVGAGRVVHVPEEWLRAEQKRDNRLRIVKMGAGIAMFLAGFAALVLGILGWTRGRCDMRAAWWVAGVMFASSVAGLVNAWPLQSMQLRTAEPLASQLSMLVIGGLVAGLLAAMLFGLTSGIGAWYGRTAERLPLAGRLPPWAAAIAAALFVAGFEAAVGALLPRAVPLWPALQSTSLWWPLGGAVLSALGFVSVAGIALFLLYLVALLTHDWTRRVGLGLALVGVLQCAATLSQSGPSLAGSAVAGIVSGLTAAAVLWWLLRYDVRMVPVYLGTGVALGSVLRAAQIATPSAFAASTAMIAVLVAVLWLIARYLDPPLPPQAPARAATASPSTG